MGKKVLFIFIIGSVLLSCVYKKKQRAWITVKNNLEFDIYVIPNYNYPDTTLSTFNITYFNANNAFFEVKSKDVDKIYCPVCSQDTWDIYNKTDTLALYVFSKAMLDTKKSFKEVSKLIIKKHHITLRDLLLNECIVEVD